MSKISEQKALEAYPKSDFQRVENRRRGERSHYINGYDQAMQDFLEKACDYLQKNLWRVEDGEFRQRFVTDFKNYMQNE